MTTEEKSILTTATATALPTPPPSLIKTNVEQHFQHLQYHRGISPDQPTPSFVADPSGVVDRDLTEELIDLKDLYDPRLHLATAPDFTNRNEYEPSTPLTEELIAALAVTNTPITLAEYMRQALGHPIYGYYTNPTMKSSKENDDGIDDWDDDDDDDAVVNAGADGIIGRRGDFVTAPEISQVFGESLAVWWVTQHQTLSSSATQLVEAGPGKGTLMADILTFLIRFSPECGRTIRAVRFIETSDAMRKEQREKLESLDLEGVRFAFHESSTDEEKEEKEEADGNKSHNTSEDSKNGEQLQIINAYWHDSFASIMHGAPALPSFIVGQEFIDALPVHVFEKKEDGWRERMVDVAVREEDDDDDKKDDEESKKKEEEETTETEEKEKPPLKTRLRVVVAPEPTPATKMLLNVDENGQMEGDESPLGQVIEVCPEGILFVQDVAKFLEKNGGAALLIDYGQEGSTDSLRGFSNHQQAHFLSRPGEIDITADVDFAALKHAVESMPARRQDEGTTKAGDRIHAFGPITQGKFLASMGAMERVLALIEDDATTDEQAERYYEDLQRLVAPEQMGERYKVLAIARKKEGIFAPPGF